MSQPSPLPPRWPLALLRAVLPADVVGDAIVGDLHEEFAHDAAQLGAAQAGTRYWRHAAGIMLHATLDELLLRSWASRESTAEVPAARAGTRAGVADRLLAVASRAGTGAGLGALAFGMLAIGIVANTVLFSTVRGAPGAAPLGAATSASVIGVGAVVLSLLCAGGAALVLCAGPRWLHRGSAPCERSPVDG